MEHLFSILSRILDALLPRRCVGCKRYDTWLCAVCVRGALHVTHSQPRQSWQADCGIRTVTTLGAYGNPVWRDSVQHLKFGKVRGLADVFGGELARAASHVTNSPADTVLVPVPMHPRRQKERGFNQSELIACVVGRRLRIPVLHGAVVRVTHSESQTTFSHEQRRERLKGVFDAGPDAHLLAQKHVIIIDDVVTTGATAAEVAKIIAACKPASIHVAAVAHGS